MGATTNVYAVGTYTFNGTVSLETHTCPRCTMVFAAPERFIDERRGDGQTFHCPAGHPMSFRETTEQKLERELKAAKAREARRTAELDQTKSALHGQKIRASRFKNDRDRERARVAAGVCPCCNRSFEDLGRHMAGQHPGFAIEGASE